MAYPGPDPAGDFHAPLAPPNRACCGDASHVNIPGLLFLCVLVALSILRVRGMAAGDAYNLCSQQGQLSIEMLRSSAS